MLDEGGLVWILSHDFSKPENKEKIDLFLQYQDDEIDKLTKDEIKFLFPIIDIFISSQHSPIRKKAMALNLFMLNNSTELLREYKEIFDLPLLSKLILLNQSCLNFYLKGERSENTKEERRRTFYKRMIELREIVYSKFGAEGGSQNARRSKLRVISVDINSVFESPSLLIQTYSQIGTQTLSNFEDLKDPNMNIYLIFDERNREEINLAPVEKRFEVKPFDKRRFVSFSPVKIPIEIKNYAKKGRRGENVEQNTNEISIEIGRKNLSKNDNTNWRVGGASRGDSKRENINKNVISRLLQNRGNLKNSYKRVNSPKNKVKMSMQNYGKNQKDSINSFTSLNSKRYFNSSNQKKFGPKKNSNDNSPRDKLNELKRNQPKKPAYTSPFKYKSRQKISRLIKPNKGSLESDSERVIRSRKWNLMKKIGQNPSSKDISGKFGDNFNISGHGKYSSGKKSKEDVNLHMVYRSNKDSTRMKNKRYGVNKR